MDIQQNMLKGWCLTSNLSCVNGGRILLAWLHEFFHVNIVTTHAQFIYVIVKNLTLNTSFQCTLVYGMNDGHAREGLWEGIRKIGNNLNMPWMVTCDFNYPLNYEDRIGRPINHTEIDAFRECAHFCGLTDLKQTGCKFTWNNKQVSKDRVYSRIDRTMVNEEYNGLFNVLSLMCPMGKRASLTIALLSFT